MIQEVQEAAPTIQAKLVEILDAIQKGAPGVATLLIEESRAKLFALTAGFGVLALLCAGIFLWLKPIAAKMVEKDDDAAIGPILGMIVTFVGFGIGVSHAIYFGANAFAPTLYLISQVTGK